jgi:hypothetical protein
VERRPVLEPALPAGGGPGHALPLLTRGPPLLCRTTHSGREGRVHRVRALARRAQLRDQQSGNNQIRDADGPRASAQCVGAQAVAWPCMSRAAGRCRPLGPPRRRPCPCSSLSCPASRRKCTPETFMLDANGSVSVEARVDANGLRLLTVGLETVSLSDVLTGVGVGVPGISLDGLLSITDASLRYVPSVIGATGEWSGAVKARRLLRLSRPCAGQKSRPPSRGAPRTQEKPSQPTPSPRSTPCRPPPKTHLTPCRTCRPSRPLPRGAPPPSPVRGPRRR